MKSRTKAEAPALPLHHGADVGLASKGSRHRRTKRRGSGRSVSPAGLACMMACLVGIFLVVQLHFAGMLGSPSSDPPSDRGRGHGRLVEMEPPPAEPAAAAAAAAAAAEAAEEASAEAPAEGSAPGAASIRPKLSLQQRLRGVGLHDTLNSSRGLPKWEVEAQAKVGWGRPNTTRPGHPRRTITRDPPPATHHA